MEVSEASTTGATSVASARDAGVSVHIGDSDEPEVSGTNADCRATKKATAADTTKESLSSSRVSDESSLRRTTAKLS